MVSPDSNYTPDFLPPRSINLPLWKSLLSGVSDLVAPEKLPPLQLTSRPVNLGMILGDRLSLPWFRTVFTNLGDVISPETLPPLELQSQPEDIGELLGDQLRTPWFKSLLRNLADSIAPERLPALQVTSKPTPPDMASNYLLAPRWSELLDTPKVFYPDAPREQERYHGFVFTPAPAVTQPAAPDPSRLRIIQELMAQKRRELRFAHIREGLWVSCVLAQVVFLVVYFTR
jgi:hypothetical protein